MFTNQLPDNEDYRVLFSEYSERYFVKTFAKKYKGKQWTVTQKSIFQDLKRIRELQKTQQVDELQHSGKFWLFKYDFAVAQTGVSAKKSGNRCLVFLDASRYLQTVILVYSKNNIPKNRNETDFLTKTLSKQFPELQDKLKNNL